MGARGGNRIGKDNNNLYARTMRVSHYTENRPASIRRACVIDYAPAPMLRLASGV